MPRPYEGESEDDFVQRYIHSPEAQASFPDLRQRIAVAHSIWQQEHGPVSHHKKRHRGKQRG